MQLYKATVYYWFSMELIEVYAPSKWLAIDKIRAIYRAKMMPVQVRDIKIYAVQ